MGGNQASRHGIVLAKSIAAKKYGIQTGEPVIQAKQKCPNLLVVPPEYLVYMKCNLAMVDIIKEYSDNIQVFSIDEVFVDYTGMERILGESFAGTILFNFLYWKIVMKSKDLLIKQLMESD